MDWHWCWPDRVIYLSLYRSLFLCSQNVGRMTCVVKNYHCGWLMAPRWPFGGIWSRCAPLQSQIMWLCPPTEHVRKNIMIWFSPFLSFSKSVMITSTIWSHVSSLVWMLSDLYHLIFSLSFMSHIYVFLFFVRWKSINSYLLCGYQFWCAQN